MSRNSGDSRDPKREVLLKFESFLQKVKLKEYEKKYRSVKTVEQDLPRELNPLSELYEHYWQPEKVPINFPEYEEFFETPIRESELEKMEGEG